MHLSISRTLRTRFISNGPLQLQKKEDNTEEIMFIKVIIGRDENKSDERSGGE